VNRLAVRMEVRRERARELWAHSHNEVGEPAELAFRVHLVLRPQHCFALALLVWLDRPWIRVHEVDVPCGPMVHVDLCPSFTSGHATVPNHNVCFVHAVEGQRQRAHAGQAGHAAWRDKVDARFTRAFGLAASSRGNAAVNAMP
jgi:hypothetical protein